MRALTLTQPWASLVAAGVKRYETRSWCREYRGPVAIHAGNGLDPVGGKAGLAELCAREPFRSALATAGIDGPAQLPFGMVLAVCDVDEMWPVQADGIPAGPRAYAHFQDHPDETAFGDYTPGRWAWRLDNLRCLREPVACSGMLGLWTPYPALLDAINAQTPVPA